GAVRSKAASGWQTFRMKNSSTPQSSSPILIGNANAPCNPALAAMEARRKLGSPETSAIQTDSPVDHTRRINPASVGAKPCCLLRTTKSLTSSELVLHVSEQRSKRSRLSHCQ